MKQTPGVVETVLQAAPVLWLALVLAAYSRVVAAPLTADEVPGLAALERLAPYGLLAMVAAAIIRCLVHREVPAAGTHPASPARPEGPGRHDP